jgi:hypothetical protein
MQQQSCRQINLCHFQRKIEVSKFSWEERETGVKQSGMESNKSHVEVHCLPLTSILLAAQLPVVDLMSLNLKGRELEVLKQIINLKQIDVEVSYFTYSFKNKLYINFLLRCSW